MGDFSKMSNSEDIDQFFSQNPKAEGRVTGRDSTHFWECEGCTWTGDNPSLNGPIMHETLTGHKTRPTVHAAIAWKGLL